MLELSEVLAFVVGAMLVAALVANWVVLGALWRFPTEKNLLKTYRKRNGK